MKKISKMKKVFTFKVRREGKDASSKRLLQAVVPV